MKCLDDAHARTSRDALAALGSSEAGLSAVEAATRLTALGPNSLPPPPSRSLASIFAAQFGSPLIALLVVAAVVAFALRYTADGAFIVTVLLVNAIIGTVQERGAAKSADALRALVPARSSVVRAGEEVEVDAATLVLGDLVLLESGAKVPADLRLLSTSGLAIDESLLTGESEPAEKDAERVATADAALGDRVGVAHSGSMVVRGRGLGVVVATGLDTQVGKIASSMATSREPKPPLLQRLDRFARKVAVAVVLSVTLVGLVGAWRGMPLAEVFLVCVALAVSAIPEGLPVALTVALSIATRRMSKRNVIVRKLVAVEALGSCTFIASDKTGTLTKNELTVAKVAVPGAEPLAVETTADHEGHVVYPADIAGLEPQVRALVETAVLASEGSLVRKGDTWAAHGDAVDVALLSLSHKVDVRRAGLEATHPRRGTIPFEAETRFAASMHEARGAVLAHVKGAFERLLPMCATMQTREGEVPLDAVAIERVAAALAEDGFRVLGFARGPVSSEGPWGPSELTGLTFLGLVALVDPLRPEAKPAVAACRKAGVDVAMVTGDHPVTAFAIARELGMVTSMDQVVTGKGLADAERSGQATFDALVARSRVFARVEPRQKLLVVEALTRAGQFVAVTGDGANDAPALRAAHVGVAMAKRGTDVAREASSLVVTDDDFASIVAGIEEGRVAYANVRKVVFLLVSTGATEVVMFLVAVGLGLPPPLLPAQLLWLNLVTNGIQDVALAFEPAEGGELARPPRPPKEPIFERRMIARVLITAVVGGLSATWLFRDALASGLPVDEARSVLLLGLVLFENAQVGAARTEERSLFALDPRRNPLLLGGAIVAFVLHLGAAFIPGLSSVLRLSFVSADHWPKLLLLALLSPLALEVYGAVDRARRRRAAR